MAETKKIQRFDLSKLEWKLSGWIPYIWRLGKSLELGASPDPEIKPFPVQVPGSVQSALRQAGIIPDWNQGLDARQCEWVENRHWIYETQIPEAWLADDTELELVCLGLDYSGWILVNGKEISGFKGTLVPHTFSLSPHLKEGKNFLQIVFDVPPRWLGQFGFTSKMTEWKPRFNYTWDWVSRLVQTGIWDSLFIRASRGYEIKSLRCATAVDYKKKKGSLEISADIQARKGGRCRVSLEKAGKILRTEDIPVSKFKTGITWSGLPVELWWPVNEGSQPLYTLTCRLLDKDGNEMDGDVRRIGFKSLEWKPCQGAPKKADPWICVINGKPLFLQGINWTPILPNFADVTDDQYRRLLETYRDLGINILRVWGGAFLEKEIFYTLCDEMGFLVWQEFPLSSSGCDNWPPEDKKSIDEIAIIAESYIARRRHHVSLALWSGGNELQGGLDGSKTGCGKPVDCSHPLIHRLEKVVAKYDPTRRFIPSSPSGPRFCADEKEFGKGVHWEIHGPWKADGKLDETWARYWKNDDALFRSEIGAPGASPISIIEKYRGKLPAFPADMENLLWRRPLCWWIEWNSFVAETGRKPKDLKEYVAWSQKRQTTVLATAVKSCKDRFPRCGGVILWMGHDCFPCTANTSIIDFHGDLKPAAGVLRKIFRK